MPMSDLTNFTWSALDLPSGAKVTMGVLVVFMLAAVTGESWMASGLAALLAWLTNVPGEFRHRIAGMIAFGLGGALITLLAGMIGLSVGTASVSIAVIGFIGTLALLCGTRPYMIGYSLICWAIYSPFLVSSSGVGNCVLAVLTGTGILIALNWIAATRSDPVVNVVENGRPAEHPDPGFVFAYAATVALVLGLTTWAGWTLLKTDPTLIVGGAFFVIGFDVSKTWTSGRARMIGVVAGIGTGLFIADALGPGLALDVVALMACFLSFATMAIHPSAFMFFFTVFLAVGWHGLDTSQLNLTLWERIAGEAAGVITAMLAIAFLQWRSHRQA